MADSALDGPEDGGGNEDAGHGPRLSGWMIVVVVGIVAVTAVAVTALATHSSSTSAGMATSTTKAGTVTTTTAVPATTAPTTTVPATTTTAPPVPDLLVCEGTPVYEPTQINWCTSACSSYLTGIVWSSWTSQSASGVGTLMTNDGVPDCSDGTWTAHPGNVITLSSPATVTYCVGLGTADTAQGLLFTAATFPGSPLPAVTPPCG